MNKCTFKKEQLIRVANDIMSKILKGIGYFCKTTIKIIVKAIKFLGANIGRYFENEELLRQKTARQNYDRKLLAIRPYFQQEIFELLQQFPTYKYDLFVEKLQQVQIIDWTPYIRGEGKNQQYMGAIYTFRIDRKNNEKLYWHKRESFRRDWYFAYEQKRIHDFQFYTPERVKDYRPCIAARYDLIGLPYQVEGDSAIYFRLTLNSNAIWQENQR